MGHLSAVGSLTLLLFLAAVPVIAATMPAVKMKEGLTTKPVLIGTWAAASWAIDFYRRSGFAVVPRKDKDALLRKYWSVPARQRQTSVVLADRRWRGAP